MRSSGKGAELRVTGRELEDGDDVGKTQELWHPDIWIGGGRVWEIQGPGESILIGELVTWLSCGLGVTM